ncbi:DUF411 domain-containing protein [Shewanella sp. D64]|uniref:DUF411 domain-containing protein n=1 Tax=unclassified Shewanella TaxID=196818 RepID=UPI0022BA57EE|nr:MULTISPECIES: DUF411 domain-containing protein [unclassified Shewanella]MEC4727711.1 DUF411 domain-containing protein [Shewanella sp. D64]MEC4739716.1 DUF411 domain-containing protein [Shewanella sp. E94]WBJ94104.1 DUF411 domain-containing protein [Shewanella sp. MTB7]
MLSIISAKIKFTSILITLTLFVAGTIVYVFSPKTLASNTKAEITSFIPSLDVYKNPKCGCCNKWINYINRHGFDAKAHDSKHLANIKQASGIAINLRSCHTAISSEGYVFEGHIPAKYLHQFLDNTPSGSIGLAVPTMPVGSPGMEYGDKFRPYKVLLLNSDGSSQVYAEVKALAGATL